MRLPLRRQLEELDASPLSTIDIHYEKEQD